jgi:hypothetical protein
MNDQFQVQNNIKVNLKTIGHKCFSIDLILTKKSELPASTKSILTKVKKRHKDQFYKRSPHTEPLSKTTYPSLKLDQSYQTFFFVKRRFFPFFLLLSLAISKYRPYFIILQTLKFNNEKQRNQSLVELTPGLPVELKTTKLSSYFWTLKIVAFYPFFYKWIINQRYCPTNGAQ